MKKVITALLLLIIFFNWYAKRPQPGYPSTIAWNDLSYGICVGEVSKDNLGKQLGVVKHFKKPMPLKNGNSNDLSVGSKIFEIKGIDIKVAIAVEKDGKIIKAIKDGPIK